MSQLKSPDWFRASDHAKIAPLAWSVVIELSHCWLAASHSVRPLAPHCGTPTESSRCACTSLPEP